MLGSMEMMSKSVMFAYANESCRIFILSMHEHKVRRKTHLLVREQIMQLHIG